MPQPSASMDKQNNDDSDIDDAGVLVHQPAYAFGKMIDQLRLTALTPHVVQYYFPEQEHFVDF